MFIDVSEVKTRRNCGRQWSYSSRNKYHLRPRVVPLALTNGTLFHECLHSAYTGGTLEKIKEFIDRETGDDLASKQMLTSMITGYFDNVLYKDLAQFDVVNIEYRFYIPLGLSFEEVDEETGEIKQQEVTATGSVDMVVCDKATREIFFFEHKTAKNFRTPFFIRVDEQPRLYFIALKRLVEKMNSELKEGEEPYKVGGVYLNEVKKLQRKFAYARNLCTYTDEECKAFMYGFTMTCRQITADKLDCVLPAPEPSLMKCQMCDYQPLCETYLLANPSLDTITGEFEEEFAVRTEDHLDEKTERKVEE